VSPCGGLSLLHVSILLHVKHTIPYRIVSYRIGSSVPCCRDLIHDDYKSIMIDSIKIDRDGFDDSMFKAKAKAKASIFEAKAKASDRDC